MSDYNETKAAKDIVSSMTVLSHNPLRARKFGSVGIEAAIQPELGEKVTDFGVAVGVLRGPVPPRCAHAIELALAEAGLEAVPVRYSQTSQAYLL